MADTDHPFIVEAVKHGDNETLTVDELTANCAAHFIYMSPDARAQMLHQIDTVLQADDGVNLRKKAQFLSLGRTLSDTHQAMRRAGR